MALRIIKHSIGECNNRCISPCDWDCKKKGM